MPSTILHVLDATTPADAVELLAAELGRAAGPADVRIAVLGHRATGAILGAAGVSQRFPISFLHSMGWADPTGWRGLRELIRQLEPATVHAWGIPAAFAAVMARFTGPRVVTLVDLPRARHLQLLPCIHKGGVLAARGEPCRWNVTASWLKRELHAHSVAADAVMLLRPDGTYANGNGGAASGTANTGSANKVNGYDGNGAVHGAPAGVERTANRELREFLGILPDDGPILLLGGDGGMGDAGVLAIPGIDPLLQGGRGGPRHDLGLWTTAILQTIFPRVRAIVREDPRGLFDPGLDRLMMNLSDENVVVVAPASCSWDTLLGISDLLLATPDGPFAGGVIRHALRAGVPVVGTPVDSVREYITHGQNGLLATSTKPREIAAAVERYFSDAGLRERLAGHLSAGRI